MPHTSLSGLFMTLVVAVATAYDFKACYNKSAKLFDTFPMAAMGHHDDPREFALTPKDTAQVTFEVYSPDGKVGSFQWPDCDFDSPAWKRDLWTRVLIHGVQSSVRRWAYDMKNTLLEAEPQNVVLVDWIKGSMNVGFTKAVKNAEEVATALACFLENLVKNGMTSPDRIHLIGHSVGAHISGFTSNMLALGPTKSSVARITGLDPVGLDFEAVGPKQRLSPDDAKFVDVIHTSEMSSQHVENHPGFGTFLEMGDQDFYPNGGHNQPKCPRFIADQFLNCIFGFGCKKKVAQVLGCSHTRAIQYFQESISKKCYFTGHYCATWDDFRAGKCNQTDRNFEHVPLMGYYAHGPTRGKAYLTTNNGSPYCQTENSIAYHELKEAKLRDDRHSAMLVPLLIAGSALVVLMVITILVAIALRKNLLKKWRQGARLKWSPSRRNDGGQQRGTLPRNQSTSSTTPMLLMQV